jgi:signal transduction histidine kinase
MLSADRAACLLFDQEEGTATYLAVDQEGAFLPGEGERVLLADLPPATVLQQSNIMASGGPSDAQMAPVLDRMMAQGLRSAISVDLVADGELIGMVVLSSTEVAKVGEDEREAVQEIADALAIGLRHARLREELERHSNELEHAVSELRIVDKERRVLLSSVVTAQQQERKQIASDIHDDTIQKVTAAAMRLDMLESAHPELAGDEGYAKAKLILQRSIESLRHLMFELHPYVLDRDGLGPALRLYLEEEAKLENSPVYHLDSRITAEPSADIRIVLYRVAQEALANVRKHARASRVDVCLGERENGFSIRITDDGVGFDAGDRAESPEGHLGLTSMRDRAEMTGGVLSISSRPDRGTVVDIWIPDGLRDESEAP